MDREFWTSFLRWLEQASEQELTEKQHLLESHFATIRDKDVRSDTLRLIRFIDQERVARLGISHRSIRA
jgi:mRNA-degrading endonuclease YafQ of YafQ-DinJ toxin-antitoxin module